MDSVEKIASILRADKDFVRKAEERLSRITGKEKILDKIVQENTQRVDRSLEALGISRNASAKEVYNALISKIESDDEKIVKSLGDPSCKTEEGCRTALEAVFRVNPPGKGFFLKEDRAREFLERVPPNKVMAYLGYDSVSDMLAREDLYEIWSSLRFIEGSGWMNAEFFKQYENLTPDDFEERDVKVLALPPRWGEAGEKFVQKKWHNISHLKEMGVVFVIPLSLGIPGELLRMISLVFHYLHEVPYYSQMFRKIAETPTTFSQNLISLLRGDVIDRRIPEGDRSVWFVIQRYLAKDDENEWRLFVPHINPEALHWYRASEDIVRLGQAVDGFSDDIGFWKDLDWVGDYFRDELGNDTLVSFNLVDTVMSLVKRKELIKYLYHHQEALWNKIFIEHFSLEELEMYTQDHLLQGYFEI